MLALCRCSSCRHTPASCRQTAGAWSVAPCTPPPPCGKWHNMGLICTPNRRTPRSANESHRLIRIVFGDRGGGAVLKMIEYWSSRMQLVGAIFHGHRGRGKDKKKSKGVGEGPPFNARCLGLHISVGDADLCWKEKVKGLNLWVPSWNLCLKR